MQCIRRLRSVVAAEVLLVSLACSARAAAASLVLPSALESASGTELEQGFIEPPAAARTAVYWCWMNGNTDLPRMTRELEEMKAKGIRCVYIFDVGARDPEGVVPAGPAFMGPESMKAIGHAVREATRLNLEVGFIISSSWNAGGPWVKPEHASMALYQSEKKVEGPVRFSEALPFPKVPGNAPKRNDGLPAFWKDVAVVAVPTSKDKSIADTKTVVDLTSRVEKDGRLTWDVPAGKWTILRFVCTNTGQGLAIPSPNSKGLVIDHLNPEATEMHFDYLFERLRAELGPFKDTALKYMYVPSYEVKGLAWTPDLVRVFREHHHYDMTPFLPALFGWTVKDETTTERFRFDHKKTLGNLLVDAFYRKARDLSHRQGLFLCAEAGGPGPPVHHVPVDALKAQGVIDIPRGEFWKEHQRLDENGVDRLWVVKETACASHIYGKRIVDMESFTSWRHWQDGPFELKPLADRVLCEGTNHFTFHTGTHQPPAAGKPGWVYHAGTHMNTNLVWWPKAGPFIDYLSRCCYLLQQGLFVADVCYYYGDQAFNFVPPKHVDPSLGPGYDYDVVNSEVILTRMSVKDGRIVLPDGMSYELLVLPDHEDMNLDVLRKLEELVKAGATVVGPKPVRVNGLGDYVRRDEDVRRLAGKLWGPCDGKKVREHTYGKGRIVWGRTLRELLAERGVTVDFGFVARNTDAELDYIHRRTAGADIYFVSNKKARWDEVDCVFRVRGKTPELWMPDTGEIVKQAVFMSWEGGTMVPLRLPPSGSVFVVFRDEVDGDSVKTILQNGKTRFPALDRTVEAGPAIDVFPRKDKAFEVVAWVNGKFALITALGGRKEIEVQSIPAPLEIDGSWEVRFPEDWGAPAVAEFAKLTSWTDHPNEGIKYFSGIATYRKDFEIPAELLGENKRLTLDLGRVRFVADVSLNGEPLGILWKPPFRVDITKAARPGKNRLVVEVANTWSNRLVGDAWLPKDKRFCHTNMTHALTWESPWKDTPLLESGLLGPVRLLTARRITVELSE